MQRDATHPHAVVVRLLAVVEAGLEAHGAVVERREAQEAVLQGLLPLLVPLEVPGNQLMGSSGDVKKSSQ